MTGPGSGGNVLAALCSFFIPGIPAIAATTAADAAPTGNRLGAVTYSFSLRLGADRAANLNDPQKFVELCRSVGAGGAQHALGVRESDYAQRLRQSVADSGMYLEGSIRLPRDNADLMRFENEVRTAKEAGVSVLRTVTLGGRRYETFRDGAAYRTWTEQAERSLRMSLPVMKQLDMRLAVENHKDWLTPDLVALIKRLESPRVGVCVDTGNNIALLEDPHEVVTALAPWAFAVHLKDMAVDEYADGFLLAEVPLGEGFLDLKRIVETLRQANRQIRFSLEMITRDPLKIPCLTPAYWATFEAMPGRQLARALALVRKHKSAHPLVQLSALSKDRQVALEHENVVKCLQYAKTNLAM